MASYLRPRRGKKATAESQAIVLKRGEVFFECPDTGVGTGKGKIKVGDGATAYASLPYFLSDVDLNGTDATIAFTDSSTETDISNNATYLTNIKPSSNLKTIFTNLKQLLYNYNSEITQLNNDLTQMFIKKTFTWERSWPASGNRASKIDIGIDGYTPLSFNLISSNHVPSTSTGTVLRSFFIVGNDLFDNYTGSSGATETTVFSIVYVKSSVISDV